MYSSSCNFNPFQYTEIRSSIQEDQSSHFLHFPPSSFLDDDEFFLSEFLSQPHHQQQQQILASCTNLEAETPAERNPTAPSKKLSARSNSKKRRSNVNAPAEQPVSRKRTGKKDRHSKIHTAQGPRDRRMRLSLLTASKFFDLQDMLGFDKASKTIDWLFTKSKAAIKELADSLQTRVKRSNSGGGGGSELNVSSTSESDVISGVKKPTHGNEDVRKMANEDYFVTNTCREEKSKKLNRPPLARERRDKARARARERTKEKKKIKGQLLDKSKHSLQENPSNSLDRNQDLGFGSQEMKCNLKICGDQEAEEKKEKEENGTSLLGNQMDSFTIVDKFLGLPSVQQKSYSIFDLSQNILIPSGDNFEDHNDQFSGFPGNWEISNGRLVQSRYCAMPNIKVSSIGNVMNVQNPNAIFVTTPPNFQEQNLTSVFMTTYEENPSSGFMNLSNSNKHNPNLNPINTTVDTALRSYYFTEDQFFCNNPKPADPLFYIN